MKFTPKTEQELKSMSLITDGIYPFEVMVATDRLSKNGNEMIELKLKIWDINNKEHLIFDYLLEAMGYKLRHFAEATGLLNKYEKGELKDIDCVGKTGNVEIIIEQGKQRPEGGYYPDKNAVKDYVTNVSNSIKSEKDTFINDDLPF